MNWNVVTLPRAREDYAQILRYLSGFYPSTPRKFAQEYRKMRQRIKRNPFGCTAYEGIPGFRRAFAGKYLVFYDIIEETRTVRIHRILRASWNISNILQGPAQEPPKDKKDEP